MNFTNAFTVSWSFWVIMNLFCRPMPTITWQKDNRQLPSNEKYVISTHNKRLTVKNLNVRDSGKYKCTFTRAQSTSFPEATLTVIGKN